MRRRGRGLGILGLIAFSAAAIAALHRLGSVRWLQVDWGALGRWLSLTPVEEAVAALVRVVALALAYWVLGSSLLYSLARLIRLPGAIRAAGWVTLPVVRRIADRSIAVLLATAAAVGPPAAALAGEPKPPPVVAQTEGGKVLRPPGVEVPGDGTETAGEEQQEEGASDPGTGPTPGPPLPSPPGERELAPGSSGQRVLATLPTLSGDAEQASRPATGPRAPSRVNGSQHVVVPGDNLWSIAADHLAAVTGRRREDLPVAEIHRYWLRVIAANRNFLRSGDPDLIYPGERIDLPPVREPESDGRHP